MKITPPNSANGSRGGFTLLDLLVMLTVIAMLVALALPAWFKSRERSARAQCVSNLRQIGLGISLYTAESDDYVPICGWPQNQNPWQTYSAARAIPGTTNLTRGFMSLGLLHRTQTVLDSKLFYCPGLARLPQWSHDSYARSVTGWPTAPPGDEQIRVSYNYYPQLRATSQVGPGEVLPSLIHAPATLEFGGTFNLVAPARLRELNPQKSIATDLVASLFSTSHNSLGAIAGVNALFPDGRVTWQDARAMPGSFDPAVWGNVGVGNDPLGFRRVMNSWQP